MSNRKALKPLPRGDNHPADTKEKLVFVGTHIPAEQHRELKAIAKANRRSLAGQIAFELGQKFARG